MRSRRELFFDTAQQKNMGYAVEKCGANAIIRPKAMKRCETMEKRFKEETVTKLVGSVNSDEAYRHWARGLNTTVLFVCEEEKLGLEIKNGCIAPAELSSAEVILSADEQGWKNALKTHWQEGFYDMAEGPGRLKLEASPLLIAANAKAFTRLWKHVRSAINGEERSWDWNV